MDLVASNLANANTTAKPGESIFRRKLAIFTPEPVSSASNLTGVRVSRIVEDSAPPKLVYDPSHPDANADGYVAYSNVNPILEMIDLLAASRAYQANLASLDTTKDMMLRALQIAT